MESLRPFYAFLKLVFVFAAGVMTAKLFLAFCMWIIATALLMLGLAGGFFAACIMTFFGIVFGIMAIFAFFVGCHIGGMLLVYAGKVVDWVRGFFSSSEDAKEESAVAPETAAAA